MQGSLLLLAIADSSARFMRAAFDTFPSFFLWAASAQFFQITFKHQLVCLRYHDCYSSCFRSHKIWHPVLLAEQEPVQLSSRSLEVTSTQGLTASMFEPLFLKILDVLQVSYTTTPPPQLPSINR
jgi:hypothetical protein